MRLSALKNTLYDIVSTFFCAANVVWTEQGAVKPKCPYITLKAGIMSKSAFYLRTDEGTNMYQCSFPFEVNIYTSGKQRGSSENTSHSYENTAIEDMLDFIKYLESDQITDDLAAMNVGITLNGTIRDLTEIQNSTMFRYRSMAELVVSYVEEADGQYGIKNMPDTPNPSGGGNAELKANTYEIESVNITENEED